MWGREQKIVESVVDKLPTGFKCLDVPVGTGRFFPYYGAKGAEVTGLDISSHMLTQAAEAARENRIDPSLDAGNIRNLPYKDAYFDMVVCFRLLTWFDSTAVSQTLAELSRVSKQWILVSLNIRQPIAEALRAGQVNEVVKLATKKRAQVMRVLKQRATSQPTLRIQRYDHMQTLLKRYGLRVEREYSIREDPGARKYVALLLETAS